MCVAKCFDLGNSTCRALNLLPREGEDQEKHSVLGILACRKLLEAHNIIRSLSLDRGESLGITNRLGKEKEPRLVGLLLGLKENANMSKGFQS